MVVNIMTIRSGGNSMKVYIDLTKLEIERNKAGFSLSDISNFLGYKTPSGYWLIEHGERKITAQSLYILAQLYSKPMDYFMVEE